MKIRFNSRGNDKQFKAASLWLDDEVEDIVYAGTKGAGKSYLGCSLIFGDAFIYPGIHCFIARVELNDLRKFTIPSIHEVLDEWNIGKSMWKYNGQDNFFELYNGSKVFLLAAKYMPSDPKFMRFGSMQMTRGWIEEAGEFAEDAMINLSISLGRWKNEEYNLSPKLLQTCNPSKNYLYKEYYLPHKRGVLPSNKRFIHALPGDNKCLPKGYVESLARKLKGQEKERLLFGNWEYDDDPDALCEYEDILAIFNNHHVEGGQKYITVDVARKGPDLTVVGIWDGWRLTNIIAQEKSDMRKLKGLIRVLMKTKDIGVKNVIVDEDGVGGGLVDELGCLGFINNKRPINKENYTNLKAQCTYKLAEKINRRELWVSCDLDSYKEQCIVEDLSWMKRSGKLDGKLGLLSKEVIKNNTGRSTDFGDMLRMRSYFDLKPSKDIIWAAI